MKKILIILMMGMVLISLTSAIEQSLPNPIKQGDKVNLTQICDSCTYVNITRVTYPNSTLALSEEKTMTKIGNDYSYEFNNTLAMGTYTYTTCGDLDGTRTCQPVTFEVTPSGKGGNDNIVFIIFIIVMIYAITFFGFFGKNIPITILGGMTMLFLGIYLINEGLIIYRDNLTIYFSYITIAVGFIMAIWAILEQFDLM